MPCYARESQASSKWEGILILSMCCNTVCRRGHPTSLSPSSFLLCLPCSVLLSQQQQSFPPPFPLRHFPFLFFFSFLTTQCSATPFSNSLGAASCRQSLWRPKWFTVLFKTSSFFLCALSYKKIQQTINFIKGKKWRLWKCSYLKNLSFPLENYLLLYLGQGHL